jgi:hypothetical protein
MKLIRQLPFVLAFSFLLFTSAEAPAQGKDHGKEKSKVKGSAKKENKATGKTFAHSTPHNLKVPPGHYPPPGMCRLWYPGRPPGQQPKSVPCAQLIGVPLTDGAFILHGDQAYDTQYDWRKEEVKKPKSVPRQIIDILFPGNKLPQ